MARKMLTRPILLLENVTESIQLRRLTDILAVFGFVHDSLVIPVILVLGIVLYRCCNPRPFVCQFTAGGRAFPLYNRQQSFAMTPGPNHRTSENSDTVDFSVCLEKSDFFFFFTHRIPSPSCSSITTEQLHRHVLHIARAA